MNQITLSKGEQARIRIGVKERAYQFTNNTMEAALLFRKIYHDIKIRFDVESYKYVNRAEMRALIQYIERWKPNKAS